MMEWGGELTKLFIIAYYSWDYRVGHYKISGINNVTLQKSIIF